ncbi:helix-turn-helix domain-containing protein [Labedella phragmitis]|uniref:Helix-turn-helix domain-containing protein n=1 Tax=Labedella phragmitis TaxID=2498849 RepID=A0A444PYF2_9MICO|nr:helix-turn-helix domain-containing protein [Labedella phragmitis]RWZ52924.1 helix-turn-helix domain-containing protein [Labedella phragmitis]
MSVESMAIALNHSQTSGTAKLVLIGIANHDGDGGSWPSVATLARYAGVTPRNVQKAIDVLVKLGEVKRLANQGGTHRTPDHARPNLYRFELKCPPTCDRSSAHRTREPLPGLEFSTGVSLPTGGVASDRGGVSRATPEPSSNHPYSSREETYVPERGREAESDAYGATPRAASASTGCTHRMVTDRHCEMGCPPLEARS